MPIIASRQRDPCKSINGGPVEFRTGEDFIQPLLHGFHAEYRNLWIYRLDGVADSCEVIFRAPSTRATNVEKKLPGFADGTKT